MDLTRSESLLGKSATGRLASYRVAVFGLGGVGSYAVEALVRSGIGALDLVDNDVVAPSNLNRQLIATQETIGRPKVEVEKERILSINPDCQVTCHRVFFTPDTADRFDLSVYNYVVDAIDTVAGKIELIVRAKEAGVPIISAMGAGNKLDPTRFEVADISKTSVCPLARVMRKELRARGVDHVKVVYSKEEPLAPLEGVIGESKGTAGRPAPGSVAFVPSVVGLIMAGEVVKDLCSL